MGETERVIPSAAEEAKDVGGRFIAGAVVVVLGSLACVTVGVMLAFPEAMNDKILPHAVPNFPQPELQPSPRDDMKRFLAAELQQLNSAGWIDRNAGVAHIPIDDAMRIVAREGIPGWPEAKR